MSQQDLMQLLFFIFSGFVGVFGLVILFIIFKYHPEDPFFIKPLAKVFWRVYLAVGLVIIVVHIFLITMYYYFVFSSNFCTKARE